MKLKHVITTLGLAAVMAFGVGAGLKAGHKEVAKADATTFYIDTSGFTDWEGSNAVFRIHCWNGTADVYSSNATLVSEHLYSVQFDVSALNSTTQGYRFNRCDPNNATASSYWNRGEWNSWSSAKTNNYYTVTGWETGNWTEGTPSGDYVPDNVWLAGSMTDWDNEKVAMTIDSENKVATLNDVEMAAGAKFKIVVDSSWKGSAIINANDDFTNSLLSDDNSNDHNILVAHAGTYDLSYNYDTQLLTISGEIDANPHTYTLVGNRLPNASAWDTTDTDYDFEMSNGNKTATLTVDLKSGDQFKIVEDHAWTTNYGGDHAHTEVTYTLTDSISAYGENFYTLTSGNYTITLTTDYVYTAASLTITRNSVLPYRAFSLVGTVLSGESPWDAKDPEFELTPAQDGKSASVTGTFTADEVFKVVQDHTWSGTGYTYEGDYGYTDVSSTHSTAYALLSNDSGNVKFTKTAVYTITVVLKNDYSFDYIRVDNVDEEARLYAVEFLTALQTTNENTGICDANGNTNTTTLKTAWNGDLAEHFDDLSDAAKVVLTGASKSGEGEINEFARLYDYIYGKYEELAALGLNDFAGRFTSPTHSPLTTVTNNNSALIIVVISSIAVLATAGFFFIRRRKEDR